MVRLPIFSIQTFTTSPGLRNSPRAEPTPREFAALIAQIKREKVKALFLEHSLSPRLLEQLSRETNVRIGGTLYADTLSPPGGPVPSYMEMMRVNTRTMVEALKP